MTCREVNAFENLLVVCLFHSVEIDSHPDSFPIELLEHWKLQQVEESQILDVHFTLTDSELREALTSVARDGAAVAGVVELANAVRAMRTTAERCRTSSAEVWASREMAIDAHRRSAPTMWDAATGETVEPTNICLPQREEDDFRSRLQRTLALASVELQPLSDRLLEAAAGLEAVTSFPDGLMAWIERCNASVISTTSSWDEGVDDPSAAMQVALHELETALRACKSLADGGSPTIPSAPSAPSALEDPKSSPADVFVANYEDVFESAARFSRVTHLPYDGTVHQKLVEACPTLMQVPDSLHWMSRGLTARQNAARAADVCRNASADELSEVLLRIRLLEPEAARALHLLCLLEERSDSKHRKEASVLDGLLAELGGLTLGALSDEAFWDRNQCYSLVALGVAARWVGGSATGAALSDAVHAGRTREILIAFASVVDLNEMWTGAYQATSRRYSPRTFTLPEWFPLDQFIEDLRSQHGWSDDADTLKAQFFACVNAQSGK